MRITSFRLSRASASALIRGAAAVLLAVLLLWASACAPVSPDGPASTSSEEERSENPDAAASDPSGEPAESGNGDESGESGEQESSEDPDDPGTGEPETDFWTALGQGVLSETFSVPDYCVPVAGSVYDTGIRTTEGMHSLTLNCGELHVADFEKELYRVFDLSSGNLIRELPYDPLLKHIPGEEGILYLMDTENGSVRYLNPDGTEGLLCEEDPPEDNKTHVSFFLTRDGKYRFRSEEDNRGRVTLSMENLKTGSRTVHQAPEEIDRMVRYDGSAADFLTWGGTLIRLTETECLTFSPPEDAGYASFFNGALVYRRDVSWGACFGCRPADRADDCLILRFADSGCHIQNIDFGIMSFHTEGIFDYPLFCDLRSGRVSPAAEISGAEYATEALISEAGFAVLSVAFKDGSMRILIQDLSGRDEWDEAGVSSFRTTPEDMASQVENIRKTLLERDGVELYVGSEGNDFQISSYVGRALLDDLNVYLDVCELDEILSSYPAGMIREAWEGVGDLKGIRLYLCGSVYGTSPDGVSLAGGVTSTEGSYIVVVCDGQSGGIGTTIPHEFSHAFDRRIEAVSLKTGTDWIAKFESISPYPYASSYQDYWKLTKYTLDASSDPSRAWYLDAYSRTFSTEDRARLMEALFESRGETLDPRLESVHLNYKARAYCDILRQCFPSLQKSAPDWERHLDMTSFKW
ncbi:MAG: hypothetical protein ILO68_01505 [Clostridia bacterium]|nr:hypothetical protein [Clostridia bacterium]